jgi:Na+:H+ antiporter, NhaA family
MTHAGSKAANFIFDNSLLLVAGTIAAVTWANTDLASYDNIAHPLHFWVNDVGMVFFFALAAKEVFEATLPGGPLASTRRALSPVTAAVGGMGLSLPDLDPCKPLICFVICWRGRRDSNPRPPA